MNILKNYINGAAFSSRSWQLTTLLYLSQLILALMVVLPFYGGLKSALGNSMVLNGFTSAFSYTSLTEFLDAFSVRGGLMMGFTGYTLLLFLLLQVFFKGGILDLVQEDYAGFNMKTFLDGCRTWFTRFLAISGLVWIAQLLLAALVWIPFWLLLEYRFEHADSETMLYRTLFAGVIIHFILATLVYLAGEYSRYSLFLAGKGNILKASWKTLVFVFRKIYLLYPLLLLLLLNGLVLITLYVLLRSILPAGSGWSIGLLLLLQQAFMWTGNMLRIWTVSSQFFLLRDFHLHHPS